MIEIAEERNASSVIRPHPADNVDVVLIDVCLGEAVPSGNVVGRAQVSARYKIAARRIAAGESIRKYKVVTGFTATAIDAGSLAHDRDTKFREFERDYAYASEYQPVSLRCDAEHATLDGCVCTDARIATRNYTAFCRRPIARLPLCEKIAEWFTPEYNRSMSKTAASLIGALKEAV